MVEWSSGLVKDRTAEPRQGLGSTRKAAGRAEDRVGWAMATLPGSWPQSSPTEIFWMMSFPTPQVQYMNTVSSGPMFCGTHNARSDELCSVAAADRRTTPFESRR